ncbi:DUF998 domain-containing protein [Streptomyces hyaluromycini]|uniref:DUF998 domain-containing protein n=1 Tax=Streptomyces hyaluromycini TaxID=1377993 RepID=UPI000B5C62A9|nr:DUF998 domain-containing protein [Streptomyces hyaluromycini]
MSRSRRLSLGAVILVVNALQWVIAEAVTAAAWNDPPYSYARNYISDLGVPDCGARFQGREICSPAHTLMDASFALQGILFAAGVVLLASLIEGRARRVVTVLGVTHGVAFVLVGIFHGSAEGPKYNLVIHVGAAIAGILCANTVVIVAGRLRSLGLARPYRVFSVTVGVLGLLSELGVAISTGTAGAFERGGIYSWLLWSAVTGTLLLAGRLPRPAVLENVPV